MDYCGIPYTSVQKTPQNPKEVSIWWDLLGSFNVLAVDIASKYIFFKEHSGEQRRKGPYRAFDGNSFPFWCLYMFGTDDERIAKRVNSVQNLCIYLSLLTEHSSPR